MWPFNRLRMGFAHGLLGGLEMTTGHVGTLGRERMQAQRCSPRCAREEDCVLMGPHDRRADHPRAVINGMPEPSWWGFLPHDTPPLIHCGFVPLPDLHTPLAWIQGLDGQIVNGWERRRFF
jgi:hypothetical protein